VIHAMFRRYVLQISILLLGFMLSPLVTAAENTTVRLQLPEAHQYQFAGYYAALSQGYYQREGLDVQLLLPESGQSTIDRVVNGQAEFGVADVQLVQARLQGSPVVMLANLFKTSTTVLVADARFRSPDQLNGRRVAISTDELYGGGVGILLERAGVGKNTLQLQAPQPSVVTALRQGRVDAVAVALARELYDLQQSGTPYALFSPASAGITQLDGNLFSHQRLAREQPELVDAFIRATLKGWRYALGHQVEMVDLIIRRYLPDADRKALLFEARETARLTLRQIYSLGTVDSKQLAAVAEQYRETGTADLNLDLEGFVYAQPSSLRLTRSEREWLAQHPVIAVQTPLRGPISEASQGILQGYLPDYLTVLERLLGVKFDLVTRQTARTDIQLAIEAVPEGNVSNGLRWLSLPAAIAYRVDAGRVAGLEDLLGQRVGVVDGDRFADALDSAFPEISLVRCSDIVACMTRLATGNIAAVVDARAVLEVNLAHYVIPGVRLSGALQQRELRMVEHVFEPLQTSPLLISALKKAIAAVRLDERQILAQRWFSTLGAVHSRRLSLGEWERAWLMEKQRIQYCVDPQSAPWSQLTGTGQSSGIATDYIDLLSRYLNIEFRLIRTLSREHSLRALQSNGCDLIASSGESGLAASGVYSRPYLQTRLMIGRRSGSTVGEGALQGAFAVPAGFLWASQLQQLYPGLKLMEVASMADAIEKVQEEEADGLILTQLQQATARLSPGWAQLQLVPLSAPPVSLSFRMAADEPQLHATLNKAIAAITEREHQNVINRWSFRPAEAGPTVPPVVIAAATGALGMVFCAFWILRRGGRRSPQREGESTGQRNEPSGRPLTLPADRDEQSGLYNRLKLNSLLQQTIVEAVDGDEVLGVILLDIDNLRHINHLYGRPLGDSVLGDVARLLNRRIDKPDLVGRWGSKQFMLICPQRNISECRQQAEDLRTGIESTEFDHGERVTASFAVVSVTRAMTPTQLLEQLSIAMKQAKDDGRNRVVVVN